MGIKLKNLFVIVIILVASCTVVKKKTSNDYSIKEEDYVKAYKIVFMFGCLNEATKGNFSKFLKDNNDLSLFSEVDMIFHSNAHIADSLGRVYSKKIRPFTYGDGEGKMPNYSGCLYFALSKEIDSLARASYRQTLKDEDR